MKASSTASRLPPPLDANSARCCIKCCVSRQVGWRGERQQQCFRLAHMTRSSAAECTSASCVQVVHCSSLTSSLNHPSCLTLRRSLRRSLLPLPPQRSRVCVVSTTGHRRDARELAFTTNPTAPSWKPQARCRSADALQHRTADTAAVWRCIGSALVPSASVLPRLLCTAVSFATRRCRAGWCPLCRL